MATKSPEATIDFLLTCIECTDGKTDWEKVAATTGWYKAGKFAKQAFGSIQKKYGSVNGNAGSPDISAKMGKKRVVADMNGPGDENKGPGQKKVKNEAKSEVAVKDEDDKSAGEVKGEDREGAEEVEAASADFQEQD